MTKTILQTQNPTTTDKKVIQNPDVRVIESPKATQIFIKPTKTLNIAITGVSGLLGSNILYEIINAQFKDLDTTRIFVLGRRTEHETLESRVKKNYFNEDDRYLSFDDDKSAFIKEYFSKINFIDFDLSVPNLNLSSEGYYLLNNNKIDCFIHIAANTDIRNTPNIEAEVLKTNYLGTKNLLKLIKQLQVKSFFYVSTAFVNINAKGVITPSQLDIAQKFNNPYEKSKALSENEVANFCKKNDIDFKVFRPSVISGRLIDGNIGAVNKFDVFYAYGKWLTYVRLKHIQNRDQIYEEPIQISFKHYYYKTGTVNIVPVDYVAKFIFQVFLQQSSASYFNVVNPINTRNDFYLPLMNSLLNVDGILQTGSRNIEKTSYVLLYEKMMGLAYSKYTTVTHQSFETTSSIDVCNKAKLFCPKITEGNFSKIIQYAKDRNFGLKID